MKSKLFLFLCACSLGFYAAFACDAKECGSGKDQCCTTAAGKSFKCTAFTPPVKAISPD